MLTRAGMLSVLPSSLHLLLVSFLLFNCYFLLNSDINCTHKGETFFSQQTLFKYPISNSKIQSLALHDAKWKLVFAETRIFCIITNFSNVAGNCIAVVLIPLGKDLPCVQFSWPEFEAILNRNEDGLVFHYLRLKRLHERWYL